MQLWLKSAEQYRDVAAKYWEIGDHLRTRADTTTGEENKDLAIEWLQKGQQVIERMENKGIVIGGLELKRALLQSLGNSVADNLPNHGSFCVSESTSDEAPRYDIARLRYRCRRSIGLHYLRDR
jgi:hypothetical protein